MKTGKCPKCDSTNIYARKVGNMYFNFSPGWFSSILPTVYVCTDCGYTEFYTESKYFDHIRQHWDTVDQFRKRKNS